MLSKFRSRLTYANVMATIALFLALGGGAYAAFKLPKNSVGTKQIKANAVNSSKVKNGSLLAQDFKAGQVPAGAQGLQGPRGDLGQTGPTGPAGPFPDPLPSGKTLRGVASLVYTATGATEPGASAIAFGFRLSSAPTQHLIAVGGTPPAGCTGGTEADPQADPGNLCVYESFANNVTNVCISSGSPFTCDQANPYGAVLFARATAAGTVQLVATWAVTAP